MFGEHFAVEIICAECGNNTFTQHKKHTGESRYYVRCAECGSYEEEEREDGI